MARLPNNFALRELHQIPISGPTLHMRTPLSVRARCEDSYSLIFRLSTTTSILPSRTGSHFSGFTLNHLVPHLVRCSSCILCAVEYTLAPSCNASSMSACPTGPDPPVIRTLALVSGAPSFLASFKH